MRTRKTTFLAITGACIGLCLGAMATTLTIDAHPDRHVEINPHIYGVNIANWCAPYYLKVCEPMLTNANVSVVRYGATNIERYNWKNNRMYNVISMTNQYVPISWESFVEWVRDDLDATPFLQMPVFAHVAADDGIADYAQNYSVQQTTQDAADWVAAAGTNVPIWGLGNEPFIAWKLVGYEGQRGEEDESYAYNDGAHGDQIYNEDVADDSFYPQFISVAEAIRGANPTAKILGPTPCNWWLYWSTDYSPFCPATRADPGDHTNDNGWFTMGASANQWDPRVFPDRGGSPDVIGWEQNPATGEFNDKRVMCQFVKRIGEYAAANGGTQVCDYLDFHRYMNCNQDSLAVQETRDLWDPDYASYDKETGGSGTKTKILTRFQNIIDNYNTNMQISLSEYDYFYWQGHPAIPQIAALGQADYLGIFANRGVQLACNWYIGEPDQSGGGYHHAADSAKQAMFNEKGEPNPKYWAFKIMSDNYRDQSIMAESSDNDAFSVYGGLDTVSSQLMVTAHYKGQYYPWYDEHHAGYFIEGQPSSNATMVVSNFTITGVKKIERYGRDDPYIVHMDTDGAVVAGNQFTYDFDPLAIYQFTFYGEPTPPAEEAPDSYLVVNPSSIDFGPYDTGFTVTEEEDHDTHVVTYTTNFDYFVRISNNRNSNTTWTASTPSPWLEVMGSGSGTADVTDLVYIRITNKSSLAVGVYSSYVTVNTSEGTTNVPVRMEVVPGEAGGEVRIFDADTHSLAHAWFAEEPYSIGFYDAHGNVEDRNGPYIYTLSLDYDETTLLGGMASMRVDFDRSAGDTSAGRLYTAFGTYGHDGPTMCWVPTNDSPSNYVFKFDIKTKTTGPGFTRTELLLVITDDDSMQGKPDVGIDDFKKSMLLEDGYWQTISIPLGTNFYDWRYPGGQDGSAASLDFSRIRQLEFLPWVGHEDKQGTLWLDNLRVEHVDASSNHYPMAVAEQDLRLIGTNETVYLTGTNSYDVDGSVVSYEWAPVTGLSATNVANPTFFPPAPGHYVFELSVIDDEGLRSRNVAQVVVDCQPTLYPASIELYRDEELTDEITGVASNCLDMYVKLTCFAGGLPGVEDFTLAAIASDDTYGPDDGNHTDSIQLVLEETGADTKIFTGRLKLAAFSDQDAAEIGVQEGAVVSVSNNGYRVTRTIGKQWYGLQTIVDHVEDGAEAFNAFDGIWNDYDDTPNGNTSVVSIASSNEGALATSTQCMYGEAILGLTAATNVDQLFAGIMTKLTAYSQDVAQAVSDLSSTTGVKGVSFWMRGNGTKVSVVLKSLSITNYDDYLYTFDHTPTSGWRRFDIPFTEFAQEGWGNEAIEREVALRNVNAVQFKFASKIDGEFNQVWVDDVALFGGEKHYLPHVIYNKQNQISMENYTGGLLTNGTFEGPNAPGWIMLGNATNEDWGNWRMVFENWTGVTTGSCHQILAVDDSKAYQFSVDAFGDTGFNGDAYIDVTWYDSTSNQLRRDSVDITADLQSSFTTHEMPWLWSPAGADHARVRMEQVNGTVPPYAANAVHFDNAEFNEYGMIEDTAWLSGWIGGESHSYDTNAAEGDYAMRLSTTNTDWLGGMFVAPYDTGDTRTNLSAFSGFAMKACRPDGFSTSGTVATRIRIAVATNEDPVARTRWYPVGASAWEDFILFPKAKFLTEATVDDSDPANWVVWSNDWTSIARIIIEYGPSAESNIPFHVLIDDFRPYSDTYVPDDIVDAPITNATAVTNDFYIFRDAGLPVGMTSVVDNVTSWDDEYTGESAPEGSECLMVQGVKDSAYEIKFPPCFPVVGCLDTPGYAWNIDVSDDYAYVADSAGGVRIIDVSDVTSPVEVTHISVSSYARGITVTGTHAYIAGNPFKSFDVSDPANPVEMGTLSIGYPMSVEVYSNKAYVVRRDGVGALAIVDVADPTNMTLLGQATLASVDCHVKVSNDTAYLSLFDTGFHAVDVSDSTDPVVLTTNEMFGCMGVALKGDYAYVGDGIGIHVFDISVATNPVKEALLRLEQKYVYDLQIVGDLLYAVGGERMTVVDISEAEEPVVAGYSEELSDLAAGIEVEGDYAFIGNWTEGLQIVSITNELTGSTNLTDYADGFLKFSVKTPVDLYVALDPGGLGTGNSKRLLSQYNWTGLNEWQEIVVPLRDMGANQTRLENVFGAFKCWHITSSSQTYYIDNVRLSNTY